MESFALDGIQLPTQHMTALGQHGPAVDSFTAHFGQPLANKSSDRAEAHLHSLLDAFTNEVNHWVSHWVNRCVSH